MQNKIFRPVITSLFVLVLFSFIPLAGLYAEEGSNNTEFVTIEKHKEQFTENIDGVEYNTTGYDYDTLVLPGNASLGLRLFAIKYNQKIKDYVENEYLPKAIEVGKREVENYKFKRKGGFLSYNQTLELGNQNPKILSFLVSNFDYSLGRGSFTFLNANNIDPLVGRRIKEQNMVLNPSAFSEHFADVYVMTNPLKEKITDREKLRDEVQSNMIAYLSRNKSGPTFLVYKDRITVVFKGETFQEIRGLVGIESMRLDLNKADLEGIFDLSYCE